MAKITQQEGDNTLPIIDPREAAELTEEQREAAQSGIEESQELYTKIVQSSLNQTGAKNKQGKMQRDTEKWTAEMLRQNTEHQAGQ